MLNRAPDTSSIQVENFLGSRRVPWGTHKKVEVGRVIRNHNCAQCGHLRSFSSGEQISCLISGDSTVSIDVATKCAGCDTTMEVWFLVGCCNDLYSRAPEVYLERFSQHRRDMADQSGMGIDDLFERAQIAFDDNLGAGAMIYLRKIFETVTYQVAEATSIPTQRSPTNRKKRPFKDILKNVDEVNSIVPSEFSDDGYRLFEELSEVIHGQSNEVTAINRYEPCKRLVLGVVQNIQNRSELIAAVGALGWTTAETLDGENQ